MKLSFTFGWSRPIMLTFTFCLFRLTITLFCCGRFQIGDVGNQFLMTIHAILWRICADSHPYISCLFPFRISWIPFESSVSFGHGLRWFIWNPCRNLYLVTYIMALQPFPFRCCKGRSNHICRSRCLKFWCSILLFCSAVGFSAVLGKTQISGNATFSGCYSPWDRLVMLDFSIWANLWNSMDSKYVDLFSPLKLIEVVIFTFSHFLHQKLKFQTSHEIRWYLYRYMYLADP